MGRKILFVTTDQQRYDSLGCNGGTIARTPVVDGWARHGINYHRAYNQNTVCMPARSSPRLKPPIPLKRSSTCIAVNPQDRVAAMVPVEPDHEGQAPALQQLREPGLGRKIGGVVGHVATITSPNMPASSAMRGPAMAQVQSPGGPIGPLVARQCLPPS